MSLAIDSGIPRHKPENPYNYDNLQLAKRKKALLDMKKDYPLLPEGWLEMVYDFNENTPQEEVEDIIKNDKWGYAGKFSENNGGIVKCGEILDAPTDPSNN